VVQCFDLFPGIFYCNFFDFCVQLFTAIFIKYCAKCKSLIKKVLQNYFSLVLFPLHEKKAIWRISCVSMLSLAKQLVCKLVVLQPQPSVANWYIYSI